MEHPGVVGIDVSNAHLDVYVRPSGDSFRVGHDDAGFATLIARGRPFTPTVVVLEATGGYEVTVAAALAGARLPVAVVNPRQIRDFPGRSATSRGPPGSWPRPTRATLG